MNFIRVFRNVTMVLSVSTFVAFTDQQNTKNSGDNKSLKNSKAHEVAQGSQQSGDNKAQSQSDVKKSPDKQLLFFMNPHGHPCQVQLSILDNMRDKLNGVATVVYVKTTEPSDENKFYQYGIRGLPLLIVADKNGKEIKRLPPGIKNETTIMTALQNN